MCGCKSVNLYSHMSDQARLGAWVHPTHRNHARACGCIRGVLIHVVYTYYEQPGNNG